MSPHKPRDQIARELYRGGLTRIAIAERFGVSMSTVRRLLGEARPERLESFAMPMGDPAACRDHWHDLMAAYPGGMPVATGDARAWANR